MSISINYFFIIHTWVWLNWPFLRLFIPAVLSGFLCFILSLQIFTSCFKFQLGHFLAMWLKLVTIFSSFFFFNWNMSLPAIQETWVDPWVRKIPWRREWQPPPVFLPGKSHGQGAWRTTVHGGHKEADTIQWLNNNKNIYRKVLKGRTPTVGHFCLRELP